jgi:hypothetical protein
VSPGLCGQQRWRTDVGRDRHEATATIAERLEGTAAVKKSQRRHRRPLPVWDTPIMAAYFSRFPRTQTELASQVKRRTSQGARPLDARSRAAFATWLKGRVESGYPPTRQDVSQWFTNDGLSGIEPDADLMDVEYLRAFGVIQASKVAGVLGIVEDSVRRYFRELSSSIARVRYSSAMIPPCPELSQVLRAASALENALQFYEPTFSTKLPTVDDWIAETKKPDFEMRCREVEESCVDMRDALFVTIRNLEKQWGRSGAPKKPDDAHTGDQRAVELLVSAGASKIEAEAVLGVASKLKKRRQRARRQAGQ